MTTSGDISDLDLARLFEAGQWDSVEHMLRTAFGIDEADARTAFRLANLLALRGKYNEAQTYYDISWLHRWPGPLCLNNRGVALIWNREVRAGLTSLLLARADAPTLLPISYNVGIAMDFLARLGGPVPPLIADLWSSADPATPTSRGPSEEIEAPSPTLDPAGESHQSFLAAAARQWPRYRPLEGPLLLWYDDLPSGFGYEPLREAADVELAQRLLQEALEFFSQHNWQACLNALEQAVKLCPSLDARAVPWKTKASIQLCREFRETARSRFRQGDAEGARGALEALCALLPGLPDRELVSEILVAEITAYAEQLRSSEASDPWSVLETLVEAVGHCLQRHDAQRVAHGGSELLQQDRLDSLREYLERVCMDAWGQQINHLLVQGAYDVARKLVERGELFWFAPSEAMEQWRWRTYGALARRHLAMALEQMEQGEIDASQASLEEALSLAREARDEEMIASFERRLADLADRQRQQQHRDLKAQIDEGCYVEVLERCTQLLETTPGDVDLRRLLELTVRHLMLQAEHAAELDRWEVVSERCEAILRHVPRHERARALLKAGREEEALTLVAAAENARTRGDLPEAKCLVANALEKSPANQRALDLQRTLVIYDAADWEHGRKVFDELFACYSSARANGDIESAFDSAVRLYERDPDSELTAAACDWSFEQAVRLWRRRLVAAPTAENLDHIAMQLEILLNLRPQLRAASDLAVEVARQRSMAGVSHSDQMTALLQDIGEALAHREPARALDGVAALIELGDARLVALAHGHREHALEIAARILRTILRERSDARVAEATDLLALLRKWESPQVEDLGAQMAEWRGQLVNRSREGDVETGRDEALQELLRRADGARTPRAALAALHSGTRGLTMRFPETPEAYLHPLESLHRQILLQPDSRVGRWWLRVWDRLNCVEPLRVGGKRR